jgi:hypothetical protein
MKCYTFTFKSYMSSLKNDKYLHNIFSFKLYYNINENDRIIVEVFFISKSDFHFYQNNEFNLLWADSSILLFLPTPFFQIPFSSLFG